MSAHPPRGCVCRGASLPNPQCAGRDPHLTSRYAAAFVRGLQEGEDPRYIKVIGTCKHYFAYDVDCAHTSPPPVLSANALRLFLLTRRSC